MTKVIAYTALHYGAAYLGYAIKSVIDAVDEYWVLYSAVGSHGHRSGIPCPETKDELYAIARDAAGTKLHWRASEWAYEGQQRDSIHQYVPDADVILTLDADEILEDGLAQEAIDFALRSEARRIRLPFIHLWRSFRRGFAHDPAYPERVISPQKSGATVTLDTSKRVWHAGYAQRPEIVEYKLLTHGHRGEFRKDCDWYRDIFLPNRQTDCHVVGSEWWNCEDIDQANLPSVLRSHPYAALDVIP